MTNGLTRREFLQATGAAALTLGVAEKAGGDTGGETAVSKTSEVIVPDFPGNVNLKYDGPLPALRLEGVEQAVEMILYNQPRFLQGVLDSYAGVEGEFTKQIGSPGEYEFVFSREGRMQGPNDREVTLSYIIRTVMGENYQKLKGFEDWATITQAPSIIYELAQIAPGPGGHYFKEFDPNLTGPNLAERLGQLVELSPHYIAIKHERDRASIGDVLRVEEPLNPRTILPALDGQATLSAIPDGEKTQLELRMGVDSGVYTGTVEQPLPDQYKELTLKIAEDLSGQK